MRTHTLTKIFNTLLVFLALALFYFSFTKLFLENSQSEINLSKLVGKISYYKELVQLKRSDSIAWNFLNHKDQNLLSENDSIFTHINSKAVLALKNEQEVTIDGQSLIRVKSPDSIIVQDGNIDIDLKANQPSITVQIGDHQYKLKANKDSSVSIKKNLNQSTFDIKKGEVNLLTKKKNLSLKAGTSTQIKNEKIETTEIETTLSSPQGRIILEKSDSLNFKYTSSQKVKHIYIERADKSFIIEPNDSINLRADRYKWGVIYQDEDTPKVLQEFTLIKLSEAPKLISPPMHSSIQVRNEKIHFKWESNLTVLFELINKDHQTIYSNIVSDKNEIDIEFKESGTFYWRVKVDDDLNQSDFSKENEFYITQYKENQLYNTVEIKRPNQLVNIDFNIKDSNQTPEFILSKTKDFKDIILKQKITSPTMSFRATTPGFYYWKVLDNQGNVELKKMLIIPSPPPVRAPKVKTIIKTIKKKSSFLRKVLNIFIPEVNAAPEEQGEKLGEEIQISWEKIEDAKEYEIEIINNLTQKKVISKMISKSELINWRPPQQRNYYYRVRYKDHWDRFSPYSPYAMIKIRVIKQKKKIAVSKKPKPKPKPKHKPKPKPIPTQVTKPKVVVNTSNQLKYELGLFYTFSIIDFNQEVKGNSNKVDISGSNSTGHALSFKAFDFYNTGYDLFLNYKSRYGEVFNSQDFYQRQLQLALSKKINNFDLYLGLASLNVSSFTVSSNQIINESSDYHFAPYLGASFTQNIGENVTLRPFFEFHKLFYQQIHFGLSTDYRWNNSYSLKISLHGEATNLEVADQELESLAYQLFSGFLYHF